MEFLIRGFSVFIIRLFLGKIFFGLRRIWCISFGLLNSLIECCEYLSFLVVIEKVVFGNRLSKLLLLC